MTGLLALAACLDRPPRVGQVDLDGDGVVGREDCDDRDPAVHPGEPDRCDDIDRDCDGVITCPVGLATGARLLGERAGDRAGGATVDLGDFDGDGQHDVMVGAMFSGYDAAAVAGCPADTAEGAVYLAYGPFGRGEDRPLGGVPKLLGQCDDRAGYKLFAGDFNRDGLGDALVTVRRRADVDEYSGGFRLVFGRTGRLAGTSALDDVATVAIDGTSRGGIGEQLGEDLVAANGRVLIGAMGWTPDGVVSVGAAYVIDVPEGGPDGSPVHQSIEDVELARFVGAHPGDQLGQSVEAVDFGEGVRDWIVGAGGFGEHRGAVYRFAFDPDLSGAGHVATDDAIEVWTGEQPGDLVGFYSTLERIRSSEGAEQLVFAAPQSHDGWGAVYVIGEHAATASGSVSDIATAQLVGTPDFRLRAPVSGDFDNDDLPDLAIATSTSQVLVFVGDLRDVVLEPADAAIVYQGEHPADGFGTGFTGANLSAADLDGDEIAEVLVGARFFEVPDVGPEAGVAYLLPGLDR